ncbi:hypothetical protein C1893_31270, partial [Pseudomonas sp. MPR-ANC1]|uniref:hypothetical protein n=1 Tax=Pseudomonas sp. MPR-ANC1 TaxID=2075548 RepID=UPI000CD38E10
MAKLRLLTFGEDIWNRSNAGLVFSIETVCDLLLLNAMFKLHAKTRNQATRPCVIAYSYARIRRLVRLGGGSYCGAVAEVSVIGFSSSAILKAREFRHDVMAALRGALRCAGILEPGLLTRVQP